MTTTQTAPGELSVVRITVRNWALIALVVFLINLVAYVGFTTIGGVFFTISDGLGLALAISMIPIITALDRILRPLVGRPSVVARWVGVTGMLIAATGSLVLLTSEVSHEFVPAGGGLGMQFIGFGLEGLWFLLLARLLTNAGGFSTRLARFSFVTGTGFLLAALGSPLGPTSLVVSIGATISFIGFVVWVVTLRRQLTAAT